jgi:hypothetical protein
VRIRELYPHAARSGRAVSESGDVSESGMRVARAFAELNPPISCRSATSSPGNSTGAHPDGAAYSPVSVRGRSPI